MTLWPRAHTPRALRRLPSLPALLLALHSEGDRMSTPRHGSHSILCLGPTLATPPTRRTCLFQTALSRTHTFTFSYVTPTYHPAVSTPLAQAHPLQLPRASGDSPHSRGAVPMSPDAVCGHVHDPARIQLAHRQPEPPPSSSPPRPAWGSPTTTLFPAPHQLRLAGTPPSSCPQPTQPF